MGRKIHIEGDINTLKNLIYALKTDKGGSMTTTLLRRVRFTEGKNE